jgi:hypothetical protein
MRQLVPEYKEQVFGKPIHEILKIGGIDPPDGCPALAAKVNRQVSIVINQFRGQPQDGILIKAGIEYRPDQVGR